MKIDAGMVGKDRKCWGKSQKNDQELDVGFQ